MSITKQRQSGLKAIVLILLLMTMLCNCSRKTYIKPEPVTVYVDKYVPVPREMYRRWSPIFGLTPTWIEVITELKRTLEVCHAQLQAFEQLQPNPQKK